VVFWAVDACAAVVELAASVRGSGLRQPDVWPGEVARREAADGAHILLRVHGARFQVWQPDGMTVGVSLSAVLPFDGAIAARAEASLRLWRLLESGGAVAVPLSRGRADRLAASLRALDAHLDGASYRTIAEAVFGPRRLAAESWKTSSLRDVVIRQVRSGRRLMNGGYRRLLAPHWAERRSGLRVAVGVGFVG